jgi:LPXTG-motif cell wall-anchored protein
MKKVTSLVMVFLALFAFSGGVVVAQDQTVTIAMMEQNDSGQSGTATLSLNEDGTALVVEINISSSTDEPQPAHIHAGTCANLDPKPLIPLESVVNGHSVTVIPIDSGAMGMGTTEGEEFAINVHKSAAEAKIYVACGDIATTNVVGMPTTGESNNMIPVLAFVALALVATGTTLSFARRKA